MLVDRHHVQYLIELGRLADGKTAMQLAPHNVRLDSFLRTLLAAATPEGVAAFTRRMQRLHTDDRLWSAVQLPGGGDRLPLGAGRLAPPAALLVLGQADDDPDSLEDGNRLPDRGTAAARSWERLHDALDRWDTTEILRWIGPLGWQQPRDPAGLIQEAEPCRANQISPPARAGTKEPRR